MGGKRELNESMSAYSNNCMWSYMGVLYTFIIFIFEIFHNLKKNLFLGFSTLAL